MPYDILKIAQAFCMEGTPSSFSGLTGGHINDSFLIETEDSSARFVLQRINTRVFSHPGQLMQNIARVTQHLAEARGCRRIDLMRTREGSLYLDDAGLGCWRMYRYVEGTRVYNLVGNAHQAFEVARIYGAFQRRLQELPGPRLHETIPHFHDTPRRIEAMEAAVRESMLGVVKDVLAELEFARRRKTIAGVLLHAHRLGDLPERNVHNDAKISNVLFDDATDKAVCVVDLDTVMPGLAVHDFGDMVRSMARGAAAEDDADLSRVKFNHEHFEAIVRGYLSEMGTVLVPPERQLLVAAARIITLEQGVRFLTDHLLGDVYFRIARPGQNLDRARVHFELVRQMEHASESMESVVRSFGKSNGESV